MTEQAWNEGEVNWDDVQTEFVPPPVSIYRGTIAKADPKASKEGVPGAELEIKFEYDLVADAESNERIKFERVSLDAKGGFRAKQLSESTGVELPRRTSPDNVREFCGALVGETVYFRTKLDTYRGKTRAKVDRYMTEEQAQEAASSFADAAE